MQNKDFKKYYILFIVGYQDILAEFNEVSKMEFRNAFFVSFFPWNTPVCDMYERSIQSIRSMDSLWTAVY